MISPNNTEEWWSIVGADGNEISLHMWGWSITTVGGSRYDLPPRRGSDITLAYKPGQVHRRKVPDARPMSLVMFMAGLDPSTGNAPPDQRLQWNDNWESLRRLVYRHSLLNDQRVRLYRRWYLTAPDFPTERVGDMVIQGDPGVPSPGKNLVTAFAWAEMTGTMDPSMTGRLRADFQLDFTLSDPYFYGDTVTTYLNSGDYVYIWNDGHDVATNYVQVDFVGPLKNPEIVNLSTDPPSWVQLNYDIVGQETIRLVVDRFTCYSLADNQNRVGLISSYGARWWVSLLPGMNKLQMSDDTGSIPIAFGQDEGSQAAERRTAGAGYAILTFRPPYV